MKQLASVFLVLIFAVPVLLIKMNGTCNEAQTALCEEYLKTCKSTFYCTCKQNYNSVTRQSTSTCIDGENCDQQRQAACEKLRADPLKVNSCAFVKSYGGKHCASAIIKPYVKGSKGQSGG